MKSWTRTLNLDDAHTLLALAERGRPLDGWAAECHAELPTLSMARRRELVRMLRNDFLEVDDQACIQWGLFMNHYAASPATAQIDLVHIQWALSHPLSLIAVDELIAKALQANEPDIPLSRVEALVSRYLTTSSTESRRKTRTVLLGALEGIGVVSTRGTGKHRVLRASRGRPHPITFAYLIRRDLHERGLDGMMASEVPESSLAARLSQCGTKHASSCVAWNLEHGAFAREGDEIRAT